MTFSEDIKKVLLQIVEDCEGNKAAAAKRLGVNPVTFWMWITGERDPVKPAISSAIDASGAYLVFRGEDLKKAHNFDESNIIIEELERLVEELKIFKLKWEGHLETVRAQSSSAPSPQLKGYESSKIDTA